MNKAIFLVSAALLFASACAKKEEAKEEATIAPVEVAAVEVASIHRVVEADAVLFPADQAGVTPKISAPVLKFLVNRGDRVQAGQLLATLENRDLTAAVAAAKGTLDQAEANLRSITNAAVPESVVKAQTDVEAARQQLDAAQKLLESRRALLEQGALARRQVDEAQVQFAQAKAQHDAALEHQRTLQSVGKQEQINAARAQVETARAQMRSAEAQLGYSEIHSPISGVVSDRPLYAGELANPGTPLLTVMDISRVVARANVPQDLAAAVKTGDPAAIGLAEGGMEVAGKVTIVSPATDPSSTTVQVWVEFANPGGRLKPGAGAHIAITVATIKNAIVAPASAILPGEEGGTAVLSVSGDTVHRKKVETGVREGDKVQILSGAAAGEQVVTVGGVGLDDKAKIRIVKGGAKDEDEKEKDKDEKK
jgi:HlyD family secretion protein